MKDNEQSINSNLNIDKNAINNLINNEKILSKKRNEFLMKSKKPLFLLDNLNLILIETLYQFLIKIYK